MTETSAENRGGKEAGWNADENPAVEGDQFLFVAAVNFAVRTFRKLRAKLRR